MMMNYSTIAILPNPIYQELREYLSPTNFISLLNVNKYFQLKIKWEIIFYLLNSFYSLDYYYNKRNFQSDLLIKLQYSKHQIGLRFSLQKLPIDFNLELISNVHTVIIRGENKNGNNNTNDRPFTSTLLNSSIPQYPVLSESEMSFLFANLKFNSFNTLTKLEISYCPYLTHINGLERIYDLDLSYCINLQSISSLKEVHKLNLTACYQIQDISSVKNAHTLILRGCAGIKDFSCLGKQYYLDLSKLFYNRKLYIPMIQDISHLSKVHTLLLYGCESLTKVTGLDYVQILNIGGCRNLTDVSDLGHIPNLDVSCCENILSFDLLALSAQKRLNLSDNYQLEQFSLLQFANLYEVILDGCWNISSISPLTSIRKISLADLPNLIMIDDILPYLEDVRIYKCPNLINIIGLQRIKRLKLSRCIKLSNISVLSSLQEFILSDCYSVHSLNGLLSLQKLAMNGMDNIIDFSMLSQLKVLILNAGHVICNLAALKNLEVFRFIGSYYPETPDMLRYLSGLENLKKLQIFEYSGEIKENYDPFTITSSSSSSSSMNFNSSNHNPNTNNNSSTTTTTTDQLQSFKLPENFQSFSNSIQYFYFMKNSNLLKLQYFQNIYYLKLVSLKNITKISFFNRINYVWIENCPKLIELYSCNNIYQLQILDCIQLISIHHCVNICRLIVLDCMNFQEFDNFIDQENILSFQKLFILQCPLFIKSGGLSMNRWKDLLRNSGSFNAAIDWKIFPNLETVCDFSL